MNNTEKQKFDFKRDIKHSNPTEIPAKKCVIREHADKYQEFFNFMNQEHELVLTISEMNEILSEASKLLKQLETK